MHISFISLMNGFPWGGSEELWYRTAKLAIEEGNKVTTVTKQWGNWPVKIKNLKSEGARVLFYPTISPVPSLLERLGAQLHVFKKAKDKLPDLNADFFVVSNGGTFDFAYHRTFLEQLKVSGKPYIVISQHNFESGHPIPLSLKSFSVDFIEGAKRFFFVSQRNKEAAERQLTHSFSNSYLISNPVNICKPSIKPFPSSRTLSMACVARFDCDFKGQDILLHALSNTWRHRDFMLTLYGAGPHEYYLNELINFYQLQEKVKIAGHVQNVDEIWAQHQMLVLPSLSEGTSLALIEACLSGRTALVTDVGDSVQYIKNEKTGFVIPFATLNALTEGLERVWLNKHKLKQLGVNAFQHAISITDLHPEETLLNFIKTGSC